MPDRLERLFVYGTLLPSEGNHRRIESHVRDLRQGTIRGVLLDVGTFPALIHGDGIVNGMLLHLDEEAIRITDFIEGCHFDPERSLYVRERVEVDLGGRDIVEAWTYFFAFPDRIKDRPRLDVGQVDGLFHYSWPPR